MQFMQRISQWQNANEYLLHTVLRVILGVILVFKAIEFISNAEALEETIRNSWLDWAVGFLVFYITVAHLLGGCFIILGLLTRIMIILQLPILIGALLFILPVHGKIGFLPELILSVTVLVMLVYMLIKGPGPISMDDYRKDHLL